MAPEAPGPRRRDRLTVALFVYGTLAPGQRAWPLLEPHARAVREATVAGTLYDTGRGYPGAVFGSPRHVVHGHECTVAARAVPAIDVFEGDEYRRVEVSTTDGTLVVAYEWCAPLDGCTLIPSGRWPIKDP